MIAELFEFVVAELFEFKARIPRRRWKPWEKCTKKKKKEKKVLKEADIKSWHVELYETRGGKGLLVGNPDRGVCIIVPPELPIEWKKRNIFENETLPKYVREEISKLEWVEEIF